MVRTTHIPCTKTHEKVTDSSEVVREIHDSRTETSDVVTETHEKVTESSEAVRTTPISRTGTSDVVRDMSDANSPPSYSLSFSLVNDLTTGITTTISSHDTSGIIRNTKAGFIPGG